MESDSKALDFGQLYKIPEVWRLIKPARAKSAYVFFQIDYRKNHRKEQQELDFVKYSRMVSGAWNQLSKAEKEPFEKLAKKDKERYLRENQAFQRPPAKKNAFLIFHEIQREDAECKALSTLKERVAWIREKWESLLESDKATYIERAQKENASLLEKVAKYNQARAELTRNRMPKIYPKLTGILTRFILETEGLVDPDEEFNAEEKDGDNEFIPFDERVYDVPAIWDLSKPSDKNEAKIMKTHLDGESNRKRHERLLRYIDEQFIEKRLLIMNVLVEAALKLYES